MCVCVNNWILENVNTLVRYRIAPYLLNAYVLRHVVLRIKPQLVRYHVSDLSTTGIPDATGKPCKHHRLWVFFITTCNYAQLHGMITAVVQRYFTQGPESPDQNKNHLHYSVAEHVLQHAVHLSWSEMGTAAAWRAKA